MLSVVPQHNQWPEQGEKERERAQWLLHLGMATGNAWGTAPLPPPSTTTGDETNGTDITWLSLDIIWWEYVRLFYFTFKHTCCCSVYLRHAQKIFSLGSVTEGFYFIFLSSLLKKHTSRLKTTTTHTKMNSFFLWNIEEMSQFKVIVLVYDHYCFPILPLECRKESYMLLFFSHLTKIGGEPIFRVRSTLFPKKINRVNAGSDRTKS